MASSDRIIWERPERATRGPAPSLSRQEIATAAVTLADRRGIEAVSMRSLAVELGVGATSLYRYVVRKDELIELMVDAVMETTCTSRSAGTGAMTCARSLTGYGR